MVKGDEGARFENMVAVSLLKHVYAKVDNSGLPYALNYLRTKEGKEVDFCLVNDDKPELMLEVKRSDDRPSKPMLFFKEKYHFSGLQIVLNLKHEKKEKGIEIRRGADYLKSLML